jgi:TonB-linked SusC/RagA family outer membrane protein
MRMRTIVQPGTSIAGKLLLVVFLLVSGTWLNAQERTITGVVRNAGDGSPVAKATITVKGSRTSTATDDQGGFSIRAAANQVLVASAVGFASQEITVGNQSEVLFSLSTSSADMEGVVVTALGIRRDEKALGYSVSKVKGEEITDAISNNWTNALTGKVAGINLIKSGGGPSGTNKIVLRGENSLNGTSEALIVVDGVIISGSSGQLTGTGSSSYLQGESPVDFGTSLNDINPEDIESVTVLKGPGASALYGARGANGAIIITTKSGRPIQKGLGVTFNSNASFESVNRWPDYQYEFGQGASQQHTWYSYNNSEDGQSTRSTSSAWGPAFSGQYYYQYDPETRTKALTRTPWVPYKNNRKDFFETGKTFINSITVEGGNKSTSARLSLTNLDNKWIIPNTGYSRNTVALSVSQKVSDKLQIASKVNYTNKKSDNLPSTGYNNQSIMYFIRGMTPNMNLDWFRDYWVPGQEHIAQTRPFSSLLDNPFLIANEMLNKSNRHGVIGNLSATYNFTDHLSLLVRSSLDYASEARSQQRPMGTQKFVEGMFRTQNIFTQEINSDFLLRYDHAIGSKITTNISAGGSRMSNRYIRDENRADQLIYPGIYSLSNSKNLLVSLPYRAEYRVNSLYGMAQVGYDNFLYLDVTGRQDWASTLASPESADNTEFFYPSVNLSGIVSEKVKMPRAISFLKLRGSWARVGSGGIVPYRTSYTYVPTSFPGGQSNPSAIANPNLRALLTTSVEAGLDVRFFSNRLTLDVAVYQNNTRGDIFQVPIDPASGYSSSIENAGLVRNKGIEIQLDGTVVKLKNGLTWNLTGTYYSNRNKIVELVEGTDTYVMSTGPANRGSIEARPGGRMGDLYGIGYERSPEGKIIYNEQGLPVTTQTMIYLGNTNPDWKGSLGTELKYKNIRLNVLFDGQFGGVAYSLTHAVLAEEGKLKKTVPGRYNGIVGDGVQLDPLTNKYVPNTIVADNIQAYYSAHFTRDNIEANTFRTDFIKLRELRLDYTFTPRILTKIGLQKANIGIYGRDLWVNTKWPSFDPEFGTLNDGQINAGFEIGQFPSTRSYGIALSIGL